MPHNGSHAITVQAQERVSYQLDVDAPIERVLAEQTNSPNNFAEEDDAIIATDTGFRVEGQTGSTTPGNTTWWGDVFHSAGPVTGITITSDPAPPVRFYLDGVQMPPQDIAASWKPPEWNVLELPATGPSFSYDFTANGTARRFQTAPNIAANAKTDSVSQGVNQTVVSGGAGGAGGDAYLVEGNVVQFSSTGSHGIRWNGQTVTADELTNPDQDPPDDPPDDPPTDDPPTDDPPEDDGLNMQALGVVVGGAALGLALTKEDRK